MRTCHKSTRPQSFVILAPRILFKIVQICLWKAWTKEGLQQKCHIFAKQTFQWKSKAQIYDALLMLCRKLQPGKQWDLYFVMSLLPVGFWSCSRMLIAVSISCNQESILWNYVEWENKKFYKWTRIISLLNYTALEWLGKLRWQCRFGVES